MKNFLVVAFSFFWNYLFQQNIFWTKRKYITRLLPKNPVILEAGAHIGSDTIRMALAWRNPVIHAFEPVPLIYETLVSRTKHFRSVKTYPLALAEKSGKAKLHVSEGGSDASSSLLSPKDHLQSNPEVLFNKQLVIDTITLDEWAEKNKIQRVDLMWLDMQGFELAALKSGVNILTTVTAIYTEVFFKELYAGAPLYPEVRQWLETKGFKVEKEELDWATSGNVLFVRKS